jgi:uncharacterized membrane protein YgaE (UPF0421/DUF939 family)
MLLTRRLIAVAVFVAAVWYQMDVQNAITGHVAAGLSGLPAAWIADTATYVSILIETAIAVVVAGVVGFLASSSWPTPTKNG